MIQGLFSVNDVSQMIHEGHSLLLAGSREALTGLPSGNWIAGTTSYFLPNACEKITSQELVFVHQLPGFITDIEIMEYDAVSIKNIYTDAPANGFTILIVPNSSEVLFEYALNAPNYNKFASSPVCGWVAGWFIKDPPEKFSYSVSGLNPVLSDNRAVAMHVSLPATKYAEISIYCPFKAKSGHTIMFDYDGWTQGDAIINGVKHNFAAYIRENNIDTVYPLISNYAGAQICVSYLKIDIDEVYTYAPVFKGIEYHFSEIDLQAPNLMLSGDIIYSMSCILNFQRPELCGKYLDKVSGPVTFGEIVYQLVNQTTVYLTIGDVK